MMASLVERLRENIIAPAFGDGSIRDGELCERLIRERYHAADRIEELEEALRSVMIGGNHVALLIGAKHPPAEATCEMALEFYGSGDKYEAWCCWQTIMRARRVLENS